MRWQTATVLCATFVSIVASTRAAHGQTCCTGSSAVFPARLGDSENALVGVAAKTSLIVGSFDANTSFHPQPKGATEVDLTQTVFVSARALDRVQVTVAVPFVESYLATHFSSGAGGGIGDASFALRWDALRTDASHRLGVAPLASFTVPSGTAADAAKNELATDATGIGETQTAVGLAFEEMFGGTVVTLTTMGTLYGARSTHGIVSRLGPELDVSLATTHALSKRWSIGALATFGISSNSWVDGTLASDSARRSLMIAGSAAVALHTDVRLVSTLFVSPPFSGLGQNELASVGLTLTLVYTLSRADCACGACRGR